MVHLILDLLLAFYLFTFGLSAVINTTQSNEEVSLKKNLKTAPDDPHQNSKRSTIATPFILYAIPSYTTALVVNIAVGSQSKYAIFNSLRLFTNFKFSNC